MCSLMAGVKSIADGRSFTIKYHRRVIGRHNDHGGQPTVSADVDERGRDNHAPCGPEQHSLPGEGRGGGTRSRPRVAYALHAL